MKDYRLNLIAQKHNSFVGHSGRCFVIGDIHGQIQKFKKTLLGVGFDEKKDVLVFCGDLINRGEGSLEALELLNKSWFYPVMGNHDYRMLGTYLDYLVRVGSLKDFYSALERMDSDERVFCEKYGTWLFALSPEDWSKLHQIMPLMIDIPLSRAVETPQAYRLGVVHNDLWGSSFLKMSELDGSDIDVINQLIYNRPFVKDVISHLPEHLETDFPDDIYYLDNEALAQLDGFPWIKDMNLVVHGHTVMPVPVMVGNRLYMETGAYKNKGKFTIIDADSLAQSLSQNDI